jgi:outer membrane protein OmpA-like peptidoglycan-associated protein
MPMTSRWLRVVVTAAGLSGVTGCRAPMPDDRLAPGDESLSLFGPGRERLDFGRLPTIGFEPGSWRVSDSEAARLEEALGVLAGGRRVFLLGVGDEDVPPEHGRQQALARALSVRRALIEQGAEATMILITGLAAGEATGLTRGDVAGPRVECAVIR